MKVITTNPGHIRTLDLGNYAYFVKFSTNGVEMEPGELFDKIKHFKRIVFQSDDTCDTFEYRHDIGKTLTKLTKLTHKAEIQIDTNGLTKPNIIGKYGFIKYNVHVALKNSGLEYKDRINEKVLDDLRQLNSRFIFKISHKDEIDEINTLVSAMTLNKKDIYVTIKGSAHFQEIYKLLLYLEYNIAFELEEGVFDVDN